MTRRGFPLRKPGNQVRKHDSMVRARWRYMRERSNDAQRYWSEVFSSSGEQPN